MRTVAALALIGALLAGCDGRTITGSFTLHDSALTSSCVGSGGYADIRQGLTVVVKDAAGAVIATSRTGPGDHVPGKCTFSFEVADVPDSQFYSIEVGRRGALTYSRAEMEQMRWNVGFSLGAP